MAYSNNNMAKIARVGQKIRFREMPTLDFSGAIDNYFNARDAADKRAQLAEQAQKQQAYSDALQTGNQDAINQAWAAYDPQGYSNYINQQQQRAEDRQWALEDMARREQVAMKLAAFKNKLAQAAGVGGANTFGTTPIGNALTITSNPDKFTPEQVDWAQNYLRSGGADYAFEQSYQKAAGKKQGEYGGAQSIDADKGYVYENGQKYAKEGTVAADEYLAANSKKLAMNDETQRVAKTVLEDIDAVERIIKENPIQAAGWGSKMSFIPGTAARDIKARIESIKGNAGVDSLLMIKKSGAGLGQIPQSQMDMLSSMMGNLDQAQSLPELKDVIARYKRIYQNVYNNAVSDNQKINSKIKPAGIAQSGGATDYKSKYGLE